MSFSRRGRLAAMTLVCVLAVSLAAGAAPASAGGPSFQLLRNAWDTGMCLDADSQHIKDNGDVVQLYTCTGTLNQYWGLENCNTSIGACQIVNQESGKCLNVDGSSGHPYAGDPIILWDCVNTPNNYWFAQQYPSGFTRLISDWGGMCLDASGSNGYPPPLGDKVETWWCVNLDNTDPSPNQLWGPNFGV